MHVFSTNIRHDASPTEALQYFGHVSLLAPSLLCSCHTSNVNIDASRSCAHQTCRHASLLLQLMYPYLNKKREEYQKALNDSIEIDFELETSLLASDPSNTPPVEKERKRKTPEKASQKKKYSKIKVSPRVNVVVPSNGKKKPTLNLKTVKSNSPKKRLTSETSEGPLQCDNKENKVSEHTSSATSSKRPVFVVPPSKKHAQQNIPVSAERGASRNAPFNNTNNGIKASIPTTTVVQAVTHVPPLHSGTVNLIAANPLRLQGTSTSTPFKKK
ncbi:hypothetical protein C9374_007608 [Naegleria lovaniensis]|uniref:Uncharacterized protein n=1 Tax=Naegleria lovaniensis TaxID=51637 RepID=A0AA88KGX0_NAELO|nr:uncharacterized protein C9374_007608 [Naegleria lovaniensis]KAG2378970.1 hypothetical protein C9374_007608 [Naegleria lovaniensis]